mgnify:CR=1 FL=1
MEKLFENEDFILYSTGHDYDFVGIIETKGDEPLTFYFEEDLVPVLADDEEYDPDEYYDEWEPDESKTRLLDVYKGLKEYDSDSDDPDNDEEQEMASDYQAKEVIDVSYFRTRDDRSTGFLSDPRQRGQFLALIKAYCPEKLSSISWA